MTNSKWDNIWNCIQEARGIIAKVAHKTPLDKSATFSRMTNGEIYLKLENLQKTGSFKIRGAYYKIWEENKKERLKVCVAASSGNHAQGVAYAASRLGIRSIIVMPEYTPAAKVLATQGYGAEVVLYGRTYDDSYQKAIEICSQTGGTFVHPFDDPLIIAGQGTIGLEIFEELPDIDIIMVPVGGGGLISGIAIALKRLKPGIKVYGVQAKGAPAMTLSYRTGKRVTVNKCDTIADAIVVKKPGELTFKIISDLVDDMILVDENEIIKAMFLLLERCKCVSEPAGALSVAALIGGHIDVKGKKVVALISGGNVDMPLLARIIEKGLVIEGREIRIKGVLPDRPGMLKQVLEVLAEAKANIISIEHDRVDPSLSPGKAEVLITMEVRDPSVAEDLILKLRGLGFEFKLT